MKTPELNLSQLRTFIAAVENQSFIGAAEVVHRSQAAVSMQIMKLEAALGQSLFERHTRRIILTAAGEALLPYARQLLQLGADTVAALDTQQLVGKVVLGAPDDYVLSLLPPVLERFSQRFSKVEIELVCLPSAKLQLMLKKGEIDLAFITRSSGTEGNLVRREAMCWVGSERHAVWKKALLPVALYDKDCITRKHALAALASGKRPHTTAYSSPSMLGLLAMVEAGLAIAALAECSAPAHLKRLGKSEGLKPLAPIDIVLIKGRKNSSSAIDRLANEMIESLRN